MITRPRINLLLLSVVCCSLLLICACGEKRQIRQTLRKFNTTTIVFPERMKVIQNGKDSMSPVPEGLKYVIYIPPEECSTCSIGHMPEYAPVFSLGDTLGFSTVIILSPSPESRRDVDHLLHLKRFDFPVWLDADFAFRDTNPAIPESRRFHCFLISSKGNPIFTGDLRRPYMQSLLKGFFRDSSINRDL